MREKRGQDLLAHDAVGDAAGGEVAGFKDNIASVDDGRGDSGGQSEKGELHFGGWCDVVL